MGIEPTRPCGQRILSPQRLPIPPLEQARLNITIYVCMCRASLLIFLLFSILVHSKETRGDVFPGPNRSMWSKAGLMASMGLTAYNSSGCGDVVQWRGEAAYMYGDVISGGVGAKLSGSRLDTDFLVIGNRYTIWTKFNKVFKQTHFYLGPVVSFSDVTRESLLPEEEEFLALEGESCSEFQDITGLATGFEMGVSHPFKYGLYVYGAVRSEWNWKIISLRQFQIGLAYAIHERHPNFSKSLAGLSVHLEYYFNQASTEFTHFPFLGVSVLF